MSKKENDLQKAISNIQNALKDKDLKELKEKLQSKVDSGGNLTDLLQNSAVQETLQNLMKDKKLLESLKQSNLKDQLNTMLNAKGGSDLKDRVEQLLNNKDSEKKKISELPSPSASNPQPFLQSKLSQVKEELLNNFDASLYENEICLLEALKPFVNEKSHNLLDQLCEYYRYKGIIEIMKASNED